MQQQIAEISVGSINPSKNNPRSSIDKDSLTGLISSIKEHGILNPLIVKSQQDSYEIIAGERRWHAAKKAKLKTVPCIVRDDLNDTEIAEMRLIENCQREGLTGYEEARAFLDYIKKLNETPANLGDRLGLSAAYINKRIAVLDLPKEFHEAWKTGELSFSHLEQFARLTGEEALDVYNTMKSSMWGAQEFSTRKIRETINGRSIPLSKACFDLNECETCAQNSVSQFQLFGEKCGDSTCMNPQCFKKKQRAWFDANWKNTKLAKQYKTARCIFYGDESIKEIIYNSESDKFKKCHECPNHCTFIKIDGTVYHGRICMGEKSCYKALEKPPVVKKKQANGTIVEEAAPRVDWHADHFIEAFHKAVLPDRLPREKSIDAWRVILCAYIGFDGGKAMEMLELFGMKGNYFRIWDIIKELTEEQIFKTLLTLSNEKVMESDFNSDKYRSMAAYFNVDINKEWIPTEEYFSKKTRAELVDYVKETGIDKIPEFKAKADNILSTLKKSRLVEILQEMGELLKGYVPKEIRDKVKL